MRRTPLWLRVVLLAFGLIAVFVAPASAAQLPSLLLVGETEDTDNLDELMKVTFDDVLISEVVTDTELLDWFPDGQVKRGPEGRYLETASLYQNPGSIGFRAEGGYIPVPNGAKAKNGRINLKKIMGSLEETAEVLKKIRTDRAAFVNWAKEQFPRFQENLRDEYDRVLLGDGSGIRARVNQAVPDADGLVVDSTLGVAGLDMSLLHFRRGQHLRAGPNADGTALRVGTMTVDDIDWDNEALVVDALPAALADNDYIFEGDAADNSAGKESMGLYGMVDDGGIVETLQNIDRTEFLWFKSLVYDATDEIIDETLLIEVDRQARLRGGGRVDGILLSEQGFNACWQTLKADRAINDPRSYTGGRGGITILFGGTRKVNLRTARKLPSTVAFGVQRDVFKKYILHDWEWDDTTGAIWKQVVDATGRKDAFYAYGSAYMEMGIGSPQKCWRIDNYALTE